MNGRFCCPLRLPRWAISGATALFASLVLMVFWSTLITSHFARIEALAATEVNLAKIVLGSDPLEYANYFHNYPTDLGAISKNNIYTEFRKRPLYGPISSCFTIVLGTLFGIKYPENMLLILSFYATASTLLLFLLIIRLVPIVAAISLTFLCTSSFAWLSLLSIPESYSLTVCGAVVTLISGRLFYEADDRVLCPAALRHALIVGIMTWLYLPLAGAAWLVLTRVKRRKDLIALVLPVVVLVVAIALIPQLAEKGIGGVESQMRYGQYWGSVTYITMDNFLSVLTAFLVFSFVSPVGDFLLATGKPSLGYIASHPWHLVGITIMSLLYIGLIVQFVRKKNWRQASGAFVWLVGLVVFYTYFNPSGVLLYTALPATILVYIGATSLSGEDDSRRLRAISIAVFALSVALLYLNIRSIA